MTTHHSPHWGRRLGASGLAAALLLSACGSGGTDVDTDAVAEAAEEVLDGSNAPAATEKESTASGSPDAEAAAADDAMADDAGDDDGMADDAMADDADTDAMAGGDPTAEDTAAAPDTTAGDGEAAPAESTAAAVELPAVEVVDLLTGATVGLDSLATPGATLVWFWAPH